MTQLFTGAPIWIWPLLAALFFVGMRARRDRTAPVILIFSLPVLGILGARTTAALPADGWIWGVFLIAYGAGGWVGFMLQRRWLLGREGYRVHLAGENLTLSVMMLMFWANFSGGVLQAVASDIYSTSIFQAIFVVLIASASGSFAGRAVQVWKTPQTIQLRSVG